jgi:hypothetical protein
MKNKNFKTNFIVFSQFPGYAPHIGASVSHDLANYLTLMGENTYIYADSTNPKYKTPCIPWGSEVLFDKENTIVIMVAGSGEHTFQQCIPDWIKTFPNIVRWQVHNQENYYSKEDKFYQNFKYWDTLPEQKVDGDLCIIDIDCDIYRDWGLKREGTCYLIKGGLEVEPERAIHKPEDFCFDNVWYNIPDLEKRKFMAYIFNTKEYFISYAAITFASTAAAMCGCKSIVIPRSNFDKEKIKKEFWNFENGVAFGLEDLPRAINTMDKVHPAVQNFLNVTQPAHLTKFVEDCYNWLQNKYKL